MNNKEPWLIKNRNKVIISIITFPIPYGLKYKIILLSKYIKSLLKPKSKFGGPSAVFKSLKNGLKSANVFFNSNPILLNDLSETVVVLSDKNALKQMIYLKQKGYIKYLLAGPNILNDPAGFKNFLASPEIDVWLTPSDFVCNLYEFCLPTIKGKCVSWPSGVNTNFWKPSKFSKSNQVLIFYKNQEDYIESTESYILELIRLGFKVVKIKYGFYDSLSYLKLLNESCLMIGFSRSESQGIAWAEAWSCDVPTFIYNNIEPTYLGVQYNGSPAPYLNKQTGAFFNSVSEFTVLINEWKKKNIKFEPRNWCLKNISDDICAMKLLKIAKVNKI